MESAAVLRVKRKRRGALPPAEALVLACKRLRSEEGGGEEGTAASAGGEDGVEEKLFKLVATVASEEEPVQKYVRDAIAKGRAAQLLRPSLGSGQRVAEDLRSSKRARRQESRYRLVASHRPDFADGESAAGDTNGDGGRLDSRAKNDASPSGSCGEFQLFDIVQEDDGEKDLDLQKPDDPDVILCNAVEMIRQRLTVSDSNKEEEHSSKEGEYVYDIYYMETASPGWIENILSVQPYTQDCELVDEERISEEIYDDEDDENNEDNWRNDYPDEDDFLPDEDKESENGSISDEDHGYIRRTWEKYQADALREFEYDGLEDLDSE
ncbi:probable RNA polymerase II nuclear localization protein SLC7A6OS [Sceloporus undulatus]|uniref:probable RNA polymerase II nuclear localization protein SLC7A6OS n=1 Tax=Sceloporus undulatus TaxID=8520 RepID=UPI001C4B95E2|nr:probable RNA polymerase II nuclear localization protein SLC7A6OS [Sceloporus undulatus]